MQPKNYSQTQRFHAVVQATSKPDGEKEQSLGENLEISRKHTFASDNNGNECSQQNSSTIQVGHELGQGVEERLDCPQFDDPDSKRGDLPTWMSRSQIEVVLQGTNQADLALNWIPLAGRDIVSDCPNEEMIQTTTSCCLVIAKIREFLEIWSRQ